MLQSEKEKAQKKIAETRKKTAEIRKLKLENEQHFAQQLMLKRVREHENGPNREKIEAR